MYVVYVYVFVFVYVSVCVSVDVCVLYSFGLSCSVCKQVRNGLGTWATPATP